jgi:hypothetical protein
MSTKLSDILLSVRDRIDEDTANRWSDVELTRYINQRVTWVQSRIETFNGNFFLRVETATAAVGDNSIGLPSDIIGARLRSIRIYEGETSATGQGSRIEPGTLQYIYDNQYLNGTPKKYIMMSGQLKWAPSLQSNSFFRFIYSVKESPLTGANSTLEYIRDEHVDVISNGAAIDALIKVGAFDTINGLNSIIKDRLIEISEDVQPTDPIIFDQPDIDDYEICD